LSAILGASSNAISRKKFAVGVAAALGVALFVALGTWQVQRRAWKLDLIERVAQRVHAEPVAAPAPEQWPQLRAVDQEYRHVRVSGIYQPAAQTLVQAVTERGAGHWLLTPLRQPDGSAVWINRGFVPTGWRVEDAAAVTGAPVTVTGLLRLSEPGGGFLRHNDPAAGRWYSRDLQALSAAHALDRAAPFFIDVEAAPGASPSEPIGGLTVIAFPNNHLVYAITWYTLALMVAAAGVYVMRVDGRGPPAAAGSTRADAD
jgi:surfeit locus 1 family protein